MKRTTALADAIRRSTYETVKALDVLGKEGYDYEACIERVQQGMNEQLNLSKQYQKSLDEGTILDEVEVYTRTTYDKGTYLTVEYWRLLPDATAPEQLSSYLGFFDFLDAGRERVEIWPHAFYVSSSCFDEAVSDEYKAQHDYYRKSFNESEEIEA